ncbi:MAG: 23S rRNA (pseudouridine1915-N3)-methyltransferase [Candidatus Azotimanducaceae bacterium]
MNIELLAAGTKPPAWIATGISEYQKRLPRDWPLEIREIPIAKRRKGEPVTRPIQEEGERMLAAITPSSLVVTLDRKGRNWSTADLAKNLERWQLDFSKVQFLIGGPDGLSNDCLKVASESWSLSNLTFPHFIVRILFAEQIYRAWSLLNNHPYHK